MTFNEFYNKIDLVLTWENKVWFDREFILDECENDSFIIWDECTDEEKILQFTSMMKEYFEEELDKICKFGLSKK